MPPGGQRTIGRHVVISLCAACTGCITRALQVRRSASSLPRRCLHGVHLVQFHLHVKRCHFASALPARGASAAQVLVIGDMCLCLGAACTGCITAAKRLKKTPKPLPRRCLHGVHLLHAIHAGAEAPLPRRCLHGVHRQKPTNCGTPFCSIRRESVDSFSEINSKDSCADYFPALFCCQGDLHHHYRQPRTDNRPVLRCEQHRLFLFILSSHYRRLL